MLALASLVLIAGCSAVDDNGRDWNPKHQPAYALPEQNDAPAPTATWPGEGKGLGLPGLGQADPSKPPHEVRGGKGYEPGQPPPGQTDPAQPPPGQTDPAQPPPGQTDPAQPPGQAAPGAYTFQLADGADVVRVSVGDLDGDLYSVATPAESKSIPVVSADRHAVIAGLRGTNESGPALVIVVLANDVRWQVRLAGGASDETVNLTGGQLGGDVELTAGVSRAEVSLPAAHGTQSVTMSGGASQLLVHIKGAAPVRVAAHSGAGSITIDGQKPAPGQPQGTVLTTPGWDTAPDKVDINAMAGVSDLRVDRN